MSDNHIRTSTPMKNRRNEAQLSDKSASVAHPISIIFRQACKSIAPILMKRVVMTGLV